MIISASRRTDIPCFYSQWFFNRLTCGFVLVRNPVNPQQIRHIPLTADTVDGFVFWTKNPAPMLPQLSLIADIPYYFQFTLTPYGKEIEPFLPDKELELIPTFQHLSKTAGRQRVVWRYDPVLLSGSYTMAYHKAKFAELAAKLAPYTDTCIVSFLDGYRKIDKKLKSANVFSPDTFQEMELLESFSKTAGTQGISLQTCCEKTSAFASGVMPARCIDSARIAQISGVPLPVSKDKNQRPLCGCAESIDLGMYHCCGNGCIYCYANSSSAAVRTNLAAHDPTAPLLYGAVRPGDVIRNAKISSRQKTQISFF